MYSEEEEMLSMCRQEAETLVKRLKHHPSILLWCGGNECYLSRDFAAPSRPYLAADFFEYDLKRLCLRLDPDRYYHVNSPFLEAIPMNRGREIRTVIPIPGMCREVTILSLPVKI